MRNTDPKDYIIPEKHIMTMQLMQMAFNLNSLQVVRCTDRKTKEKVWCIMLSRQVKAGMQLLPIAKLFEGDPCVEMRPPNDMAENSGKGNN